MQTTLGWRKVKNKDPNFSQENWVKPSLILVIITHENTVKINHISCLYLLLGCYANNFRLKKSKVWS